MNEKRLLGVENLRADQIYYEETRGKSKIEFRNDRTEPADLTEVFSRMKWMAPELHKMDSKPVSSNNK